MVTAKLLDKFQSSKIIFLPSGLDLDDAPAGFSMEGLRIPYGRKRKRVDRQGD